MLRFISFLLKTIVIWVIVICFSNPFSEFEDIPNFRAIKGIENRKRIFFDFLRPIIIKENERILKRRAELVRSLKEQEAGEFDPDANREWLDGVFHEYRLDKLRDTEGDIWKHLIKRIDVIPVDLALAQGASESAWGMSRFATYGNSMFGQWTYSVDNGMIPLQRKEGAKHRVATFKSVKLSVRSYLRNLNTHWAYVLLREKRHKLRKEHKALDSAILVDGLLFYSEKREEYIENIKKIIRINKPLMGKLPVY